jgi:hypothetical protein
MAAQNNLPTPSRDVSDLLAQITEHGTPFRIDGATGTYNVLSADQLMTLLRGRPEDGRVCDAVYATGLRVDRG